MTRPRPTLRARLTIAYALVFCASTGIVLAASYWLLSRHLERSLPDPAASDAVADVAAQYALAFAGALLLSVAVGWLVAGRLLAPIARIAGVARRVSGDRLDERVALQGPADELRDLAEAIDAMLAELARAFGAQRRFVANASHELRGPLAAIRTEAEVTLADPEATPQELRAMGAAVIEATRRSEALLDGLLALARSQRALLRREPVDLAAGAAAAARQAAGEARAADVRVRVDAQPALASADRRLADRLIGNLVDNAVRHNRRGGTVDVATGERDGVTTLRVSNTGAVLDDAAVARLTEPFERLDGRSSDGAGLGLSIVQAVVEAHGGELGIAVRPGGGLDVEVVLPRALPS